MMIRLIRDRDRPVRYDRMIATILALPATGETARAMVWRQLVDLVAQVGDRLEPDVLRAAQVQIAALRPIVSPSDRRSAAVSLAGRATVEAVAIFAADEPAVAAPVLTLAQLDDVQWRALIPALPPTSRAILRNRRDLSPIVERALASYGASDFALPSASEHPASVESASQIRALVERIEAFRSQQPDPPISDTPVAASRPLRVFQFETTPDGVIDWTDGEPRTALIGLSIADAAPPRGAGVDGQAAGAFRRRAPFRDARLAIAGAGPIGGDWLIGAQPIFNPRNGRFVGYRGDARRPRPEEHALRFAVGEAAALAPDSLRQLVHELRTPLNAIQGFAQMIDQQMLGPAASAYRGHAKAIMGESQRLIEVVEDLDMSARLDSNAFEPGLDRACALSTIVERVAAGLAPTLNERAIAMSLDTRAVTQAGVGAQHAERLAHRLLVTVMGLAAPGETITVSVTQQAGGPALTVGRPRALVGMEVRDLLDPNFGPDGEWPTAPLLGLGFSLRLLTSLAHAVYGSFDIGAEAFSLSLPSAISTDERTGQQG